MLLPSMACLIMFQFPTFAAQFAYSFVSAGVSSAERVLELLNTETELDQNIGGHAGPMDGSLKFDQVTFYYEGSETPALEDINFEV